VHIAPGAILAGCVAVGECSLVGARVVVLPHRRVGKNVVIGAGAVVTRDIPDDVVAYGSPARVIRIRK
jgi:acetyltransferase-like isoleucine patch superfamily enzyme